MIVYQFCRMNEWLPRNLHERMIYLNHPFNFNDPTENNFGIRPYSRKENSDEFLDKLFKSLYDKDLFSGLAEDKSNSIYSESNVKLSESFIKNKFINDLINKSGGGREKKKYIKEEVVLRKPTGLKVEILDEFKEWEEEFIYKAIKTAQDGYRIGCFTNNWHSSLMWGHYADGMRGVCLKYDIKESDIHSVVYGSPYEVSTHNIMAGKVEQEVERTFLKKNKDWEYEEEVRIIKREDSYKIEKGDLKGVYFGYKCDPGKAKFVCDIARAAHGKDVKFFVVRNSQVDHTFTHEEVDASGLVERMLGVKNDMGKFRTFLNDRDVSELMRQFDN